MLERMARTWPWIGLSVGSLVAIRIARAEETPRGNSIFQRSVAAPKHALELAVRAGYDQGVGALGGEPNRHVQDVAGVGAGADIGVSYRWSPRFSLGGYATGAVYSAVAPNEGVRSFAGGVQAGWHFRPYRSLDPWASVGAGYRVFWDARPNEGTTVRKALEAFRFSVGVDYRLSPEFGVGPYVAGDLSFFFSETSTGEPSTSQGAALSSFVSAGVSARFDLLGQAIHPAIDVARR
jgi:hypothetical protein